MQTITALKCPECEATCTEDEALQTRLYECGECGTIFNRKESGGVRCAECNKFAQRVDSLAGAKGKDKNKDAMVCPSCETIELEEITALECPFCDETMDEDAIKEHLAEHHVDEVVAYYLEQEQE